MIGQGGGHGRLRHNPALCHECLAVDGDDEMEAEESGRDAASGSIYRVVVTVGGLTKKSCCRTLVGTNDLLVAPICFRAIKSEILLVTTQRSDTYLDAHHALHCTSKGFNWTTYTLHSR